MKTSKFSTVATEGHSSLRARMLFVFVLLVVYISFIRFSTSFLPRISLLMTTHSNMHSSSLSAPVPHHDAPILINTPSIQQLTSTASTCELDNVSQHRIDPPPQVWEVVRFSDDIDILELHLWSLFKGVDRFVIVESTKDALGHPKPLFFAENRARFAPWMSKISHRTFSPESLDSPPTMEGLVQSLNPPNGTLVIELDANEILDAATIALLKNCHFQTPLELRLKTFVYSYEFQGKFVDKPFPVVKTWDASTAVSAVVIPDQRGYVLAAGTRCSLCYRTISEYQLKLPSHPQWATIADADVGKVLNARHIQRVICEGSDIFRTPPVWDYFFRRGSFSHRVSSLRDAPTALRFNPGAYLFLIPGACFRQSIGGDVTDITDIKSDREPLPLPNQYLKAL